MPIFRQDPLRSLTGAEGWFPAWISNLNSGSEPGKSNTVDSEAYFTASYR